MMSLFLDTSYAHLVLALFKDDKQLFYLEEECNNDLSIKLLSKIEEALDAINQKIENVEKIFVVTGPGSFTGIRIGVTVAKTLAWSLGIGVVPISEIEVLATSKTNKKYFVPMIDARRDFVYTGMYDKDLNCIFEDEYVERKVFIDRVLAKVNLDEVAFLSYDSFEGLEVEKPIIDLPKLIAKHLRDKEVDAHILIPNYLKKTEAEEKLKRDS